MAAGLLLGLIGQCAGDPEVSSTDASDVDIVTVRDELPPPERLFVRERRYVQPGTANCRAEPSTSAAQVERLDRNDWVGVLKSESGWSLLDRADDCWVRNDLLGEDRATVSEPVRSFASVGTSSRYGSSGGGGGRSSGSAYYRNCAAARAAGAAPVMRGEPGYSRRLDRDGDGVGCE